MTSSEHTQATVGHVGIEATDFAKSKKFYKALLEGLGLKIMRSTEDRIAFSNQNFSVWISKSPKPRTIHNTPTGEESVVTDHLAILVQNKKEVYDIEEVMKKNGFQALFPCEEHPQFHPGYYAVSFCDPDNYVIEVYTR